MDKVFARENIGGLGFGTSIFMALIRNKPQFEALSPDNPFLLMTGPLTGCGLNATARWAVCSKSPLTGFWGDANAGGYFGARAKDDRLSKRLMTPLKEGPTKDSVPDMALMLKEFYQLRGLDETGVPRKAVLKALGLNILTDLLYPVSLSVKTL